MSWTAAQARLLAIVAASLVTAVAPGCARRAATAAVAAAPPAAIASSTAGATSSAASSAATGDGAAAVTQVHATKPAALSASDVHAGLEDATSEDCLGCHTDAQPRVDVHRSHPIGHDMGALADAAPSSYRPLASVVASGLVLPDGKIACRTCHDLASPYQHRIALPAGAVARRAVVLGDPSTYGDDGAERPAAAQGEEISPKPLCQACHAF